MDNSRLSASGIPVLVCAHSRRAEMQNLITNLVAAGCKKIYVNIDNSNNYETQLEQKLMRDFITNVRGDFPDLKLIGRQSIENLGAAVSIISSLDWFFSQEDFGLILEDDLELDPGIFDFSQWAMSYYAHNPEVWIVAGSNFFSDILHLRGKIHTTNYPVTWGWGSWSSKWQMIRRGILQKPPRFKCLKWNRVVAFWSVGSKRAQSGFVDAWDTPLANAMYRIGAKSVVPPFNLIRNIGFSHQASNTRKLQFPLNRAFDSGSKKIDLIFDYDFSSLPIEEMNALYEKQVYGVQFRHFFSPMFSVFDSYRFRKSARGTPSERLNKVNKSSFTEF